MFLNEQNRRIAVGCKLFGPLSIALLDEFTTTIAIWSVLGLSVFSVLVKAYAIAKVCVSDRFSDQSQHFTLLALTRFTFWHLHCKGVNPLLHLLKL